MDRSPDILAPLIGTLALLALAGCAVAPDHPKRSAGYAPPPVVVTGEGSAQLQGSLLALADTSIARIAAETTPQRLAADPAQRRMLMTLRLTLVTAMLGIVTGPEPVDGLLDFVTHTTLVAGALERAAADKPPGSSEARLFAAAKKNEADAWALAARYADQKTLDALRERIMQAAEREGGAVSVAYLRLSDVPRSGGASIEAGEGVFDTMRAATQQADQIRMLGERSLFLVQRMPFVVRWQADAFTEDSLARPEVAALLKQLEAMAKSSDDLAKAADALPSAFERERAAALNDAFKHIRDERTAAIDQMALEIRKERQAMLEQLAAVLTEQRKSALDELAGLVGVAEGRGAVWIGGVLLVGVLLIAVLLGGLLGTLLLYRRLAPRLDRA